MNIMLDIIGSTIIAGMIIAMVFTVNGNVGMQTYIGGGMFHVQTEAMQLARIIEFEVYKAGYNTPSPKIMVADSSHFKFRGDIDNDGTIDVVDFTLGDLVPTTQNPTDHKLTYAYNGQQMFISYSVTLFQLTYYNRRDSIMVTPVLGALLDSIRSIKIRLNIQTPQQMNGAYIEAYYEKLIYPRNLIY